MVKRDGSTGEMEVVYLGPVAVQKGPFPVDGVPDNLAMFRISSIQQKNKEVHTSYGRRVGECYATGGARREVSGGLWKLGKKALGRSDWKMKPGPGLALSRMM